MEHTNSGKFSATPPAFSLESWPSPPTKSPSRHLLFFVLDSGCCCCCCLGHSPVYQNGVLVRSLSGIGGGRMGARGDGSRRRNRRRGEEEEEKKEKVETEEKDNEEEEGEKK
ncbi:hypothetical protein Pcinc_044236 [Petrolisthes cinctipes]|uniref:Uncharacterized protein n=1 Tax=Petrolisthes cinctipes TaxID=88211 RepID=A0AAE1BG78_PETCI|nr:hypothetical protein Pcinc_044236 [Petrolisthes cinctipes]